MTATEAAKILGVTKGRIAQLIGDKRLHAVKIDTPRGPVYEITEQDIEELRKVWPYKTGRPLTKRGKELNPREK